MSLERSRTEHLPKRRSHKQSEESGKALRDQTPERKRKSKPLPVVPVRERPRQIHRGLRRTGELRPTPGNENGLRGPISRIRASGGRRIRDGTVIVPRTGQSPGKDAELVRPARLSHIAARMKRPREPIRARRPARAENIPPQVALPFRSPKIRLDISRGHRHLRQMIGVRLEVLRVDVDLMRILREHVIHIVIQKDLQAVRVDANVVQVAEGKPLRRLTVQADDRGQERDRRGAAGQRQRRAVNRCLQRHQ